MFSYFIVLLGFITSLGCKQIKCLFLYDEPCMFRPTIIDKNPNELKYYLFMISLNKCTGCCNVLSPKICFKRNKRHKC